MMMMMMMMMMMIIMMRMLACRHSDKHTPQRVYYSRVLDHQVFVRIDTMSKLTTVTRAKGQTLTYRVVQCSIV